MKKVLDGAENVCIFLGMELKEYIEAMREPTCRECGQSQDQKYIDMVKALCNFAYDKRLPLSMAWGVRVAVSKSMRECTCPNSSLGNCKLWRDGAQHVVSYKNGGFELNAEQ